MKSEIIGVTREEHEALHIGDVRRSSKLKEANKRLDEVDFFDLMQNYRIADMADQENVVNRFEAVKEWIRQNYA